jgi:Rrf2 family protein
MLTATPCAPAMASAEIFRGCRAAIAEAISCHDMKISKRGEYALRALIDLGIANELGRPIIQVSELAQKEQLPTKFLEQIFTQLKSGGFVKSKRGALGGYSLAKPMHRIKFGAVIRLIDGPLAPIGCVSLSAYSRCTCPDEAHCGLRMLMLDVRTAIGKILDRYTLADIVDITLRKLRRDKVASPFQPRVIDFPGLIEQRLMLTPPEPVKPEKRRRVYATRGTK